jgi:phosphoglycolate phosphatase
MPIRLAIFDLDGTLVNSLDDLADSMNEVLRRRGHPTHPADAYRHYVGDGIAKLVARALPADDPSDALVETCIAEMRAEYATRRTAKTRPYPGIPELLDELTHRGTVTAVLSNKPDEPTREIVQALFAEHRFAVIRGARPDTPLKPDPTAALAILDATDTAPTEAAFLGDTNIDMATARAAGMIAIGVSWGFRDADELRSGGAHHVIDTPAALLDLLS